MFSCVSYLNKLKQSSIHRYNVINVSLRMVSWLIKISLVNLAESEYTHNVYHPNVNRNINMHTCNLHIKQAMKNITI